MALDKIKIQKTALNLIGHFDQEAKVEISEKDATWKIDVQSDMAQMLIGRHGQTLQALEHVLRLMVTQEAQEFSPVFLDVAGYRLAMEESIIERAKASAQEVLSTGQDVSLPPMNAFERRIVHMTLTEIPEIETESIGEEPDRKIVIKKRS